ncbi:MAG: histidinol-phosphate transaminase [Planctomycetota bacterium]|jgi:histidinol-phosphate aminotransferase
MARGYFRPNVDAMTGYVPGEQPAAGGGVVKLNTNENPYPPSPKVLEAVGRSAEGTLRLYPDPTARALREAASRAYGFGTECIVAGNGSDELLAMLVRAFASEGERVAYPVPTYSLYRTLVRAHGAEAVEIPWADGYAIPPELVKADARLVILCRPNAPTGTMVPVDAVRELARSLECVLCVDEAYVDFADSEDDNCLPLVREFENVVVLRTLSKSFSLAGARVGLGFAQEALVRGLGKVKDSYNLSRMALAAGEAALGDMDWMRANAGRIRATRARLVERLARLGFECLPSQANFVLARIGHPRAKELYEALKARGILVRYFDQEAVRDCVRITVGTDAEVDALLSALGELIT